MAVVEFINGANKTHSAMKRVINYIQNPAKTEPYLIGGFNCDSNNAFNQLFSKSIFGSLLNKYSK